MTSSTPLLAGSELQEQIDLESTAVQNGVARYRKLARDAVKRGRGAQLKPVERMMVAWIPHLTRELLSLRRMFIKGGHAQSIAHWGPILALIDPEQAAFIALDKTLGLCLSNEQERGGSVAYTTVATAIGAAIVAQINLTNTTRALRKHAKELRDELIAKKLDPETHKAEASKLRRDARRERAVLDNIMDRSDAARQINRHARRTAPLAQDNMEGRASLGARILSVIAYEVAVFPSENEEKTADDILAFKVEVVKEGKKKRRVIRLRDKAMNFIAAGHQVRMKLRPIYLPMIVPPYHRDRSVPGGFITLHTPFVTKSTPEQQAAYKDANLAHEFDALTAIGATPFRLFTPLLDVCRAVSRDGGGVLGVPPIHDGDKPQRPGLADSDPEIEKAWKKEAGQWYDRRIANLAAREGFNQAMVVADMFEGRKAFYFPHHNDFRGRVYPIPQHLNSHGPDLYRALLTFSRSVEPDMHWVQVHTANCAGFDKTGFDERAAWARDWAADHSVSRWIGKTSTILDHMDEWGGDDIDSPWQFLAGLIAMHKPEWAARLPVQFDGAANGLQHYAMLTRDENLAEIVNLTPADKPAGIYNLIATKVRDILRGETDPLAAVLLPMIDKDIVKQPTMTTVYGVTFSGAQTQIMGVLKDKGVAEEHRYPMASYLTKVVLKAVRGVCGRAAEAMDFIEQSARAITATGEPYSVTSPSGLPMLQPYREWKTKELQIMEGAMTIVLEHKPCPIARGEQIRGAAPNTIHTIDQAHLKKVVVMTDKAKIDTRFNHDGYSAHSGNVARFKPIVHERFVDLHRTDWLATFHAEWKKKHPKAKLPDPPERGWFDIETVINAPYAFH